MTQNKPLSACNHLYHEEGCPCNTPRKAEQAGYERGKSATLARLDLIRKLDRTDDEDAYFFGNDGHTMTMTRKDYDKFRDWLAKEN